MAICAPDRLVTKLPSNGALGGSRPFLCLHSLSLTLLGLMSMSCEAEELPVRGTRYPVVSISYCDAAGDVVIARNGAIVGRNTVVTVREVPASLATIEVRFAENSVARVTAVADDPIWGVALLHLDRQFPATSPLTPTAGEMYLCQRARLMLPQEDGTESVTAEVIFSLTQWIPDLGNFYNIRLRLSGTALGLPIVDGSGRLAALVVTKTKGKEGQLDNRWVAVPGTLIMNLSRKSSQPYEEWLSAVSDEHGYEILCGRALHALMSMPHSRDALRKAVQQARSAVEIHPSRPEAWLIVGFIQFWLGEYSEASASYRQLAEMLPESPAPYLMLGKIHKNTGRLQEAEAEFQRALELRPDYPWPYSDLGRLYGSRGEFDKAIAMWSRLRELRPQDPMVNYLLGANYARAGMYEEAEEYCLEAVHLEPLDPMGQNLLARVYCQRDEYERALPYARQAVVLARKNPAFWATLGEIYVGLKGYENAVVAFGKALQFKPEDKEIEERLELARSLLRKQREELMWRLVGIAAAVLIGASVCAYVAYRRKKRVKSGGSKTSQEAGPDGEEMQSR